MIVRTTLVALALAITACGSDAAKTPDAGPAGVDAPAGAACTGKVYDPCTDNSQCTSGTCHLYSGSALQVCTQACSGSVACPDASGTAVTCNMMGNCKPPAANACTR